MFNAFDLALAHQGAACKDRQARSSFHHGSRQGPRQAHATVFRVGDMPISLGTGLEPSAKPGDVRTTPVLQAWRVWSPAQVAAGSQNNHLSSCPFSGSRGDVFVASSKRSSAHSVPNATTDQTEGKKSRQGRDKGIVFHINFLRSSALKNEQRPDKTQTNTSGCCGENSLRSAPATQNARHPIREAMTDIPNFPDP